MRPNLLFASLFLATLAAAGCRPLMFWRETLIQGQTKLVGKDGTSATTAPVTLNFINLQGSIEDSLISAQTDSLGKYRSPKLLPGKYTVEAMVPGFIIERTMVVVKNHEFKRVDFTLRQIGEAEGLSMKEAEEDNIRAPGQVRISRPKF